MEQKDRILARANRARDAGRIAKSEMLEKLAQQDIIPWGPIRTHGPQDVI